MARTVRRVAILGGNRIPFARAGGPYARASNQEMLAAALDGLVDRHHLDGVLLGEFAAGAVLKHARDHNLARETVLGSRLDRRTPAYDLQQACGTGLEAVALAAQRIALGQTECAVAGGVDTVSDAPIGLNDDLRRVLLRARHAPTAARKAANLLRGLRPRQVVPDIPVNAEPRTGLSMGEHAARTARQWDIGRAEQDALTATSHQRLHAAYERGFFDCLVTPYRGLARDQNLRPDSTPERLARLTPVFGTDTPDATMTAGNSTPSATAPPSSSSRARSGPPPAASNPSPTWPTPRSPPSTSPAARTACSRPPSSRCPGCSPATACTSPTSTASRSTRPSPPRCWPP